MMGTIGMASRGLVVLRLLWLLVRDEVSESSRGPGAIVSQRQRVKQVSSLTSLGKHDVCLMVFYVQYINGPRRDISLVTKVIEVG